MYVEYSKTKVYVDFMKLDINKRETERGKLWVTENITERKYMNMQRNGHI